MKAQGIILISIIVSGLLLLKKIAKTQKELFNVMIMCFFNIYGKHFMHSIKRWIPNKPKHMVKGTVSKTHSSNQFGPNQFLYENLKLGDGGVNEQNKRCQISFYSFKKEEICQKRLKTTSSISDYRSNNSQADSFCRGSLIKNMLGKILI